jgi:hypothetical protein
MHLNHSAFYNQADFNGMKTRFETKKYKKQALQKPDLFISLQPQNTMVR